MRHGKAAVLTLFMALVVFLPTAALADESGGLPAIDDRVAALEGQVADLRKAFDTRVTTLEGQVADLGKIVLALQGRVATLESNRALALAPFVSVDQNMINGLRGPHVILSGANVHVQSGLGLTDDRQAGLASGLGNLVVGYNEVPVEEEVLVVLQPGDRHGSHNVIIGPEHRFSSVGGFVVGFHNTVSGDFASVSGGSTNTASGDFASVSGGGANAASGDFASVSGGASNTASGVLASVSGGAANTAKGVRASVSGGSGNTASGGVASVSGGTGNTASGGVASVSGGGSNTASGSLASVSGGSGNTASGLLSSVSGGAANTASGARASVSGGLIRSAPATDDWAAGALFQDF
ncbi:MAG: hypothetical protein AUH29_06215 [Candidatus Rokubacteria bacterium 13_1_40CM_69_27]|nr:MAG: hypothetical protein AUH29_06215 [Candidatus Rokubacteria bacterium 13_1_40CM_69_27]